MPISEFPNELLQDIFEHLANIPAPKGYLPACYDDHAVPCVEVIYSPDERYSKGNLAQCALVSRQWCMNVRPLLFRTLALRFTPVASEPSTRTLQDIATWLKTTSVRAFVQEFRLILTQRDESCRIGVLWGGPLHYDASLLSHILSSFSYLRTLKLVDVRLDRFAQLRLAAPDSELKKPEKLNLDTFHYIFNKCSPFCGSQSLPDLLYLMTWIGHVKDLYIGFVPLVEGQEHSTKGLVYSKGLRVSNASIEGDLSIHLIIEGLRDSLQLNLSKLQTLSVLINVLGEDVLEHIPPLIEMVAPYTHNLSFNLIGLLSLATGGVHSIPDSYTAFDLNTFISLRTLRFDIPVGHFQFSSISYEMLVWSYLSSILSTTAHLPHLEEITILLQFQGDMTMFTLLEGCGRIMGRISSKLAKLPSFKKLSLLKRNGNLGGGSDIGTDERERVQAAYGELNRGGLFEYEMAEEEPEVEHLLEIVPGLQARPW